MTTKSAILAIAALLATVLNAQQLHAKTSIHSAHRLQFVVVDNNIKLEVLDWGGAGRPLVFLAGSGFDAHVFDEFAPKLSDSHHVYAITRRGFGASSAPVPADNNYSADRLGDDVLAVIDALKLQRPVLIGHSIAGQELSSIGSRHPDKIAGLIYLDAAYSYAYYSPKLGDPIIDAIDLNKQLNSFLSRGFQNSDELRQLKESSSHLERSLQALEDKRKLMPPQPPKPANVPPPPIPLALSKGRQKYTHIRAPLLAIFADPHEVGQLYKDDAMARAAVIENDRQTTSEQADALQSGVSSARVIRIPNADHFIFRSNEAQVIQEMKRFIAGLH